MSSSYRSLKCRLEGLLSKMSEMRDSRSLTDVTLKVCEKSFDAHRVVLAASSEYFSAMFTGGMQEGSQKEIELKDDSLTPAALQIILDFVYKSEINITEENVFEVLGAADHLQMTSVIEMCSEFISESLVTDQLNKLDIQNLQKVLTIAERHSLIDLQEEVLHRMALIFKEVSETEEFHEYIDHSHLLKLLQRNNLTAPSETFVLQMVTKWIFHNKEERLGHAATLIGAVRLGLVDIKVLITELRKEELKGECWKMLHEVSLYHHMPALLPELSGVKIELRTTSYVLVAIRRQATLKFYDVKKKAWQEFGGNIPVDELCGAVTSFGNYIYVGGYQAVYRYSIDSNTWDKLPAMRNSKGGRYQLIVLGEYLYAIGNYPERYSFREKSWQRIANSKTTSSTSASAVLNSCIYAVDDSLTQVFDASKNRWVEKKNNLCCRSSGYAFVYNDKLIIAGGTIITQQEQDFAVSGGISRLRSRVRNVTTNVTTNVKTVEVYCEKNDRWSEVTQTHIDPDDDTFAFEAENTIFLKLQNLVFDTGIRVSPDDPFPVNLDEWRNVTASVGSGSLITYAPLNLNKLLGDMKDSS